jgi:peroxiredoxin (alkyl hydroperoxide reductase subunit C)
MVPGRVPFLPRSDAGGRIGRVDGVYAQSAVVNTRGRFLIEPDDIIQAMEVLSPPVGRSVSELTRQIRVFQDNRTATGEVMPVGW